MLKDVGSFYKTLETDVLTIQSIQIYANVSVLLTRSYKIAKH